MYMTKEAIQMCHAYLCEANNSQKKLALKYKRMGNVMFDDENKISEFINKNGFKTDDGSQRGARYSSTRVTLRNMKLSLAEFEDCLRDYHGATTGDFIEHVKAVRSGLRPSTKVAPKPSMQSSWPDTDASASSWPDTGASASSWPDNNAFSSSRSDNSAFTSSRSESDASSHDTVKFIPIVVSVVVLIGLLIAAVFFFRGCNSNSSFNNKNAVQEIQFFVPNALSGLTIGETLDGVCNNGTWTTYETTEKEGFFKTKTTWVRFNGHSEKGSIHATFTLTDDRILNYTCHVDGNPVALDTLYSMFYDPNYKDPESETETPDPDTFSKGTQLIALVQAYQPAEFDGDTILTFLSSICENGDWSVNEALAYQRIVFEGDSDKGRVQAIFTADENSGEVSCEWYFKSMEITASDLYHAFNP